MNTGILVILVKAVESELCQVEIHKLNYFYYLTGITPDKSPQVEELENGTFITYRETSKTGGPTVDIHHTPDGNEYKDQKIHFL